MVRTLGGLAAAMTSTAALLAYIDPSATLAPQPLSLDELAVVAHSLVVEDVTIDPTRWRAVELIPTEDSLSSATVLAAVSDTGDAHFYVDAWGRPSRSPRWSRQAPSDDAPHAIRIAVAGASADRPLTAAQRESAGALLAALQQHVGIRD